LEKIIVNVSARPARTGVKMDGPQQMMARPKSFQSCPSKTLQVMDKAIHSDEEDG
jgi:hypothetical protein